MDGREALRDCFASTLSSDLNVRSQSEMQLKQADKGPGFIATTLDIVEKDADPIIRQSAAVYLKNKVARSWDSPTATDLIEDNEKSHFREQILPVVISSEPQIRKQLMSVLTKILSHDFPTKWPAFLDITVQLLRSEDFNYLYTGVLCLLEITRVYRYRIEEKRNGLDTVISSAMPLVLELGSRFCGESSTQAAGILHMIFKSYKCVITLELSPILQKSDSLVPWGTLFLRVVGKELPEDALSGSPEERESHPWWRAKKWAYHNLYRLFNKYGNPTSLVGQNQGRYKEFAAMFTANFAPEILKAYFHQVELWASGKIWLSRWAKYFIIVYFDDCIKPKTLWTLIKGNIPNIISHVVFPILCFQSSDAELWNDDPVEYIHRKVDLYDDGVSPDIAACGLLITLASKRKKASLNSISGFLGNALNSYNALPLEKQRPEEKEGMLRMLGAISNVLLAKNSPLATYMESTFIQHVLPEFKSPYGFLRARACQLCNTFSDLEFKDASNLASLYGSVRKCMTDDDLPVRVEAALALQPLIRHNSVKAALTPDIAQVMQQLLSLINEVDVDTLSNVMEEFVEVFAQELTPFAVQLTESLRHTFMRITQEMLDKAPADDIDINEVGDKLEYVDDVSLAALGVLNTISTLILTLENTPEVIFKLEDVLFPIISRALESEMIDLYGEVFEIIDSCSFSSKTISPTMWKIFEMLYKCFKNGGMDFIDEMLPPLDNYVSFGGEVFHDNPQYLAAVVDIIDMVFSAEPTNRLSTNDRICACKLVESVLLNHRGYADQYVLKFLDIAMTRLTKPNGINAKSYRIYLIEMVVNCIYYNTRATLQCLESRQWTGVFFNIWFSNMDKLSRVHDKKLSIVAITSLLTFPQSEIPESVKGGWPQLMHGLVSLYQTLPQAERRREEMEKEFNDNDALQDSTLGYQEEWADEQLGDEDADVVDDDNDYLDFYPAEEFRATDVADSVDEEEVEIDDSLGEEPLFETPLDKVDLSILLREYMSSTQPSLLKWLLDDLSEQEKTVIQSVMHKSAAATIGTT